VSSPAQLCRDVYKTATPGRIVATLLQDVWVRCVDCATDDPELHYRSGRMSRCYDCQNYMNLTRKATGGGVEFTREQFLRWKAGGSRVCVYCGVTSDQLYRLGIVNPRNKRPYESIGVDRIDNMGSYSLDNIVSCCGPCNAIRGGILSFAEMIELGPFLRKIWDARLLRADPLSAEL
jgi:hypothetical protein